MKQWKLYVLFVVMVVVVLGACNESEDYENELLEDDQDGLIEDVSNPVLKEENVELIFRHTHLHEDIDQLVLQRLETMIDTIEEKIGIMVTLDEGTQDSYGAMLSNEATRNELPHIIEMDLNSYGHAPFFYEETEHLLDLTDFLEESGLIDQFHSLDSFTVDGRVYGIPVSGQINQLFYKKDLVEELGGVPETLDDLVELMEEANHAGYNPIYLDDFSAMPFTLFEGILQQTVSSEKIHDLLNGEANWTDDEFVATFEMMEALKEVGISIFDLEETEISEIDIDGETFDVPENESYFTIDSEAFLRDDIVFSYNPYYLYISLLNSSGDYSHMQGNIGVMTIPGVQGEQSSVHGSFTSGYVFRGDLTDVEKQMIFQFIEILLSEEMMVEEQLQYESIPSIRVAADAANDELFQEIIRTTNEADGVFQGIREFIPPAIYDQVFYQSEIIEVLNNFIFGDQSIQEAVETLQNFHESVLQEANLNE